jgi:hypothetical protein
VPVDKVMAGSKRKTEDSDESEGQEESRVQNETSIPESIMKKKRKRRRKAPLLDSESSRMVVES